MNTTSISPMAIAEQLDNQFTRLTNESTQLKGLLVNTNKELGSCEEKVKALKTDVSNLQKEKQELQSQMNSLNEELRKNNQELQYQKTIVESLNDKNQHLSHEVNTVTALINSLEQRNTEWEMAAQASNKFMMHLVTSKELMSVSPDDALGFTALSLLNSLQLVRAAVWRTGDDGDLYCVKMFDKINNAYSDGTSFPSDVYADFFTTLQREEVIAASKVGAHPLLQSLITSYFEPFEICSALFVPMKINNQFVVVSCEAQQPERNWSVTDISIAKAAGMLAVNILERTTADKKITGKEQEIEFPK